MENEENPAANQESVGDAHVFDQTNGALGPIENTKKPAEMSDRDRRRQSSIAQGLGYISTGHN